MVQRRLRTAAVIVCIATLLGTFAWGINWAIQPTCIVRNETSSGLDVVLLFSDHPTKAGEFSLRVPAGTQRWLHVPTKSLVFGLDVKADDGTTRTIQDGGEINSGECLVFTITATGGSSAYR